MQSSSHIVWRMIQTDSQAFVYKTLISFLAIVEPRDTSMGEEALSAFRERARLLRAQEALVRGDFTTLHADSKTNTYVYVRTRKKDRILVGLNNSEEKQDLTVKSEKITPQRETLFTDLLTEQQYGMSAGNICLTLEPYTGVVLADSSNHV